MPIPTAPRAARALVLLSLAAPLACAGRGTTVEGAVAPAGGATVAAITEADLRTRIGIYADDSMRGRKAGTEDNLRSTAYIEREVRRLGLQPAGDAGSYFQSVPLVRRGAVAGARVEAGGKPMALWSDIVIVDAGPGVRAMTAGKAVYAGSLADTATLAPSAAGAGKVVVGKAMPGMPFGFAIVTLQRRYPEASAVMITNADRLIDAYKDYFRGGSTYLAGSQQDVATGPNLAPVMLVTVGAIPAIFGSPLDALRPGAEGATISGDVRFERSELPARNVVAVLPGSDASLRGQFVALGAHSDHVGTGTPVNHDSLRAFHQALREAGARDPFSEVDAARRAAIRVNVDSLRALRPARMDSIFNGADDDASGSMALLEIAERFAAAERPRRSLLFVWHTAEELGLFGSEWFTEHPTVPRDSIVAQLNVDMIGRGSADDVIGEAGGPQYVELIGARRLSRELGEIVDAVNARQATPFRFDYGMDATGHPEQIYCRSDHANYARYGIPVAFFTTGQHMDYHQVTDEPQYLNWPQLLRVTRLVADVAQELGNRAARPALDAAKPDPAAACRQ